MSSPFQPSSFGAVSRLVISYRSVTCGMYNFEIVVAHTQIHQLALALARLFEGPKGFRDTTFHRADQQALCSLISFNIGAFIGRIGDRVGPLKRIWLIAGCLLQALLTMAAAICIWKSGQAGIADVRADPSWTTPLTFVGLAFMSASLGVQGIQGKRLNTQFGTTSTSGLVPPSTIS